MGAVAFTKVVATDNQIVYSWTGDAAGTLAYATLTADVGTTSTIGKIVAGLAGQCDSQAKARAALLTGSTFTGAVSNAAITSNIQCKVVYTSSTTGTFPGSLDAVDDGAANNPALAITTDAGAASTGFLYITHVHSIVQ